MTVRNSFAGLPAFLFGDGGLHNQLVCDVRTYVRANDGSRDLLAPMLAWSPGPPAIGDTGDNSPGHMMGATWLLQVCPDGSWVLYREERGRLEVIPWDDPPDLVTPTARHISLCFDQAARVVLAWEDQGIIRVRRWDAEQNQYIENVSFAGVDPVVVFDAQWAYQIPGSDVLLFYLSPDRERVLCRVQRDVYAVEHEIWDYGGGVIPGPPDPRTDDQASTTTTGSAYPAWSSDVTINAEGWLTHVRADAFASGTHSLSVNGGAPISASGGPGVIEFELPSPLRVLVNDVVSIRVASPGNARVNYAAGAHTGSLWSANSVTFEGFGPFAASPALGLTIDVAEPIPVPGQPVILDRVIALPYRYQVLVSDGSGVPLPSVLVSDLYPVPTRAELRVAGEFHVGAYDLAAYEYEPTVAAALAGEFTAGALTLPVVKVEPLISVAVAGAFAAGALEDVVTKYQPQLDVRLTGEFISGELADIGTRVERNLALGLAGEFVGGVYEPA